MPVFAALAARSVHPFSVHRNPVLVVAAHLIAQEAKKMRFVQHNHMVQHLQATASLGGVYN
jgi:hypothetical protein